MKDSFADLGLDQELLTELATLGYEEPTPIQKAAIPPLVEGRDLLGQAATGTGKTAAFALPMLHRLGRERAEAMQPLGLVLVPTRELAVQVSEAFGSYGKGLRVSVVPVFGGADFRRQAMGLRKGAQVVVADNQVFHGQGVDAYLEMTVLEDADVARAEASAQAAAQASAQASVATGATAATGRQP